VKAYAPAMKIVGPVGPGSVGEGGFALVPASMPMLQSADLLGTPPKPHFDIFSYQFYGGVSKRCAAMGPTLGTTPDDALSEGWLSRTDSTFDFYKPLHDQYAPWADMLLAAGDPTTNIDVLEDYECNLVVII
jgi:heparanase